MSMQSLYLAVGAILLDLGDKVPFFTVFALAMVCTWYIFYPLIFARTAIVDYYKFDFGSRFHADGTQHRTSSEIGVPADTCSVCDKDNPGKLSERAYANVLRGRMLRRQVAAAIPMPPKQKFRTMRQTRLKLDLLLPASMTLVWIIFAVYFVVIR